MIELKSSDDFESPHHELDVEDNNSDINIAKDKSENQFYMIRGIICLVCLLCLTNTGSIILWLSESQFSHGVLRYKYLDEPCSDNSQCANGFFCDYVHKNCQIKPIPCSPYDDYYNYGNGTPKNYSQIACPVYDPPPCPPQYVQKQFTYFDFNEFPNHWLDPGYRGFYDHDYSIPYGACKEICARDAICKGICYNGLAQMCWRMTAYTLPPIYNSTYTCAIKTFS